MRFVNFLKPAPHSQKHEEELSARQIFIDYILVNKVLWYIAFANAFIYLVPYGVLNWAPNYLKEAKEFSIDDTGNRCSRTGFGSQKSRRRSCGLTGLFGYLGGALFVNIAMG